MGKFLKPFAWLTRSSALRLALMLSCVFAVGMAVSIFVAFTLGEDAVERRFDTTLEALAKATSLEDVDDRGQSWIMRAPDDLRGLPNPFRNAVRRGGGSVQLGNDFKQSDAWRVLVTTDADNVPVVVAVPLEDSEEALDLLSGILWTTAVLVIIIAIGIGLAAGLLAQRRLRRINKTLDQLAASDLTARTGLTRSKDDIDDIARQLDLTADQLERLVAQTRNLSASVAHDLRTPLARLRAQLEMLPQGPERGAALEEAEKLSTIFDTIMRVARIEATQGSEGFDAVDLGALVEEMVEIFEFVVEDAGKTLIHSIAAPQVVQGDRQMIIQALANMIQNALVHGGDRVELFTNGTEIGVADNGPGVDPADYDEILKPMVRLEASRTTEGSGLGLALVRAVADRHAAKLGLAPNTPSGLRISLNFAKM